MATMADTMPARQGRRNRYWPGCRCEAAAGVRGKQHRTDREGGKKRGLGYGSGFGPGFHDSFLLQNQIRWFGRKKNKNPPSFLPSGRRDERPKTLRGTTLFLRPRNQGTHSLRSSYPCTITGAPVCTYSSFSAAAVQPVRQVCTFCASARIALL